MAKTTQPKATSPSDAFVDLLQARSDVQRSLDSAPPSLKALFETALEQINEQLAPLILAHRCAIAKTWHKVSLRDQQRIRCTDRSDSGICGEPAVLCYHMSPGYLYYCQVHAHVGTFDRVWSDLSLEDMAQIWCSQPGCDEHAYYVEWEPIAEGKGRSNHYCQEHSFRR